MNLATDAFPHMPGTSAAILGEIYAGSAKPGSRRHLSISDEPMPFIVRAHKERAGAGGACQAVLVDRQTVSDRAMAHPTTMLNIFGLRTIAGPTVDVPVMGGSRSSTTETNAGNGETVRTHGGPAIWPFTVGSIHGVKRSDRKFVSGLFLAGLIASKDRRPGFAAWRFFPLRFTTALPPCCLENLRWIDHGNPAGDWIGSPWKRSEKG